MVFHVITINRVLGPQNVFSLFALLLFTLFLLLLFFPDTHRTAVISVADFLSPSSHYLPDSK